MDTEQQLFGLMAVAEEHQKAVQAAIDGLAAERAALAKERAAMAQAAAGVTGAAGEVRNATGEVVQAVQKAAGEAVEASVRQSLAGASAVAENALGEACLPIVGRLSGVVKAAGEAEGKLSGAVAAFSWRWAMLVAGAVAGGIVTLLWVAWLAVWWQRHQVEQLAEQRQELADEIQQMEVNVAKLEKRGGRLAITTCDGRLCIEASTNQGRGWTDWQSPWKSERGTPLVIPRGY